MAYQALYRTYRPKRFSDVIGQEHVVRTLLNSVRQGKIGHAYLFSGPRGTGKTTVARLLARTINCAGPIDGEPCGKCDRCSGPEEGLGVLEIDAASHGSVDDMRQLVAQVSQVPLAGGKMVYIIDEVHMLSKEAFNAFLKTLEEPPEHAIFVLATTEPGKLLPTIHSRCQHFSFRRVSMDVLIEHIRKICDKENIKADDAAVRMIARAGDGSVRDSISVLEQAIAYEPDGLTLNGVRDVLGIPDRMDVRKLGGFIINKDPAGLSQSYSALISSGREPLEILSALVAHFRDLLLKSMSIQHADLEMLPDIEIDELSRQAENIGAGDVHNAIAFLAKCESEIKWEEEAALILEVSLLRLAAKFRGHREPAEEHHVTTEARKHVEPTVKPHAEVVGREEVAIDDEKPVREKTLSGGISLKKKREPSEPIVEPAIHGARPSEPEIKPVETPSSVPTDSDLLEIPADIDPLWKNTLESIRELSIAEYILLARAVPSPPPSEWGEPDPDRKVLLTVTLKYKYEDGLILRQIKNAPVMNRLTSRLEEVLERPIDIRLARARPEGNGKPTVKPEDGMYDGEGHVDGTEERGGPSLFPGAGREVPADPDLRRIHNLIVQDFPDYEVESR